MSAPSSKAPIRVEWAKDNRNILSDLPNVAMSGDRFYKPMWVAEAHEWADFDGCVMSVDPSGRGKDETGYAVVRLCQGMMWLVAAGGYLGGYENGSFRCSFSVTAPAPQTPADSVSAGRRRPGAC